jgi:hypothetical protein
VDSSSDDDCIEPATPKKRKHTVPARLMSESESESEHASDNSPAFKKPVKMSNKSRKTSVKVPNKTANASVNVVMSPVNQRCSASGDILDDANSNTTPTSVSNSVVNAIYTETPGSTQCVSAVPGSRRQLLNDTKDLIELSQQDSPVTLESIYKMFSGKQ